MTSDKALIFVYNADSGIFPTVGDFVKKIATPDEYDCNLCMVTYSAVKMKPSWKDYLETIPNEKIFLHRDEFLREFSDYRDTALPVICIQDAQKLSVLVSADEINAIGELEEMKKLMQSKLNSC